MTPTPARPSGWAVAAVVGALALGACSGESNLNKLYPDIVVAPDSVDFGGIVVPYSDAVELQVINAGRARLTIDSIAVGAYDGVYTVSPAMAELGPDESVPVLVTFEPATYINYGTDLVLQSDDPEQPELRVPITAEGIDGPVPEIAVDTLSLDFGKLVPGSTAQQLFTITNTGTGPLEISDESGQTKEGAFSLTSDPAGRTIEAGGSYPVIVDYAPVDALGDWSIYQVKSNDPLVPQVDVLFVGNGGGDYNYPVAVIDAATVAAPLQSITFDGSGSYDPQGYEPLTYSWTLFDQPGGSSTSLSDSSATAPSMFIDAAGLYTIILQVDNAIGVSSDPVTHQLLATPASDLYVLMSWSTPNSDLDLHLVQDDPSNYFFSPEDCCFCNPSPSWGSSGSEDDPDLALDNRVGYGPENINIESPADGLYYIRAHYFEDFGGGTTEATIEVYLSGAKVAEFSNTLTDNWMWDVATVSIPDGKVTAGDVKTYQSPYRACQ